MVELVIGEAAQLYRVDKRLILRGKKHKLVSAARAAVSWASRQLNPQPSYPEIAATLRCKRHCTVLSAARRLERQREADPELRALTDRLLERVRAARAAELAEPVRAAS